MKIIPFMLLLSFCLFADEITMLSANCIKHPIYCQIVKNKPDIDKDYAMKLSGIIFKYANKYKVNARLFTAILGQESMYSLKARNCDTGIQVLSEDDYNGKVEECNVNNPETPDSCIDNIEKYKRETVCFDWGISQINYRIAETLGIDIYRLTTDLDYSVEMGAKLLGDIRRRYENKEPIDWWTRYNSSTRIHRDEYEKLVKRRM